MKGFPSLDPGALLNLSQTSNTRHPSHFLPFEGATTAYADSNLTAKIPSMISFHGNSQHKYLDTLLEFRAHHYLERMVIFLLTLDFTANPIGLNITVVT